MTGSVTRKCAISCKRDSVSVSTPKHNVSTKWVAANDRSEALAKCSALAVANKAGISKMRSAPADKAHSVRIYLLKMAGSPRCT